MAAAATTATMLAHRFTEPKHGLQLTTIPIPTPSPDQILVQVKAAGICHTDHNLISGKDDTFLFKRPITLGHEIAGVVVQVGSNVQEFKEGDKVVSLADLKCPFKLSGVATAPGIGIDGGFAEYVILQKEKVLKMPAGDITFADAAVATDAVATAYHALITQGGITKDSKVAIIGLGGLGMSAAQLAAKIVGAKVWGIETDSRKFPAALENGVQACAKSFAGLPGKLFDVVVDFAGAGVTTAGAIKAVEIGGTVVLVGLGKKECTFDTFEFVAKNVIIKGSTGSSPEEIKKCMDLIAEGKFVAGTEEIPFKDIGEGVKRLARGDALGRLWADPSKRGGRMIERQQEL